MQNGAWRISREVSPSRSSRKFTNMSVTMAMVQYSPGLADTRTNRPMNGQMNGQSVCESESRTRTKTNDIGIEQSRDPQVQLGLVSRQPPGTPSRSLMNQLRCVGWP